MKAYRLIYVVSILCALIFHPISDSQGATVTGDVNGDGKIDLKEAIFALQVVSGLKIAGTIGDVVVFAWNDLGMHCLNPSYDTAVILPPYNTVWAQIVSKGAQPQSIIQGIVVDYQIVNNSYSYGKRDYGQFWDNMPALFGASLPHDQGLNLVDPDIHNGLQGRMVAKESHFEVDGIPLTPVNDSGAWDPYQIIEVSVKDSLGRQMAQTKTTVPTSDEINCQKCHGSDPFADILAKHDAAHASSLASSKPVLCASCHGSPALGQSGAGSSGKYLSRAIHGSHATRGADCYDCHPGQVTQCNRSLAHKDPNGNCITCHGDMAQVSGSIATGTRIPWLNEPKCSDCHIGVSGVDTGQTLYRFAKGHGGLYCSTCHGSPHAMVPSVEASDNFQSIQYQNKAKSIGSCGACHEMSRGAAEGIEDFAEKHGGTNPERLIACHVCHTSISSDTSKWPHGFQWKNR